MDAGGGLQLKRISKSGHTSKKQRFKKRNNRALRAAMTDFERFQVMVAKRMPS